MIRNLCGRAVRTPFLPAMLVTLAFAADATAQTTEREVLGWTSGNEAVVHVVERGQRMVDGVSKDYYVEATEVWNASGTSTLYKNGEPVGPAPGWYAGAKPEDASKREGLGKDVASAANPAGTHRFAWYAKPRIDKPDERNFICTLRYRVVVLVQSTERVHTVLDATAQGEPSRRQDEARCPDLSVEPHWSPDGNLGFALIKIGSEVKSAFAPVTSMDELAWGAFTPTLPAVATLGQGVEAAAWRALDLGDYAEARKQFEAAQLPGGAALVDAFEGDKRATKKADAAYRKSKKANRDQILRAAAYIAAGNSKKATGWIDDAVKKAGSFDELLSFAAVFELVDPNIANQLAVHALSHASAASADTTAAWTLLAEGLLDLGEYSKADEALRKIEKQTPASLAAQATLHLDKRQTRLAQNFAEDLLFENPGDCRGYLLEGRLRTMKSQNHDARALFEAAAACDPGLEEAVFYAADFARLGGNAERAKAGFDHYLRVAPTRGADQIRALRRAAAKRWSKALGHDGVVLIDVSCRRGGAGYLCAGTLKNTTNAASGEVGIEVKAKGRKVGSATVADIEPGATAPFGVSFTSKSLDDVTVAAGRNSKERRVNEAPAK